MIIMLKVMLSFGLVFLKIGIRLYYLFGYDRCCSNIISDFMLVNIDF